MAVESIEVYGWKGKRAAAQAGRRDFVAEAEPTPLPSFLEHCDRASGDMPNTVSLRDFKAAKAKLTTDERGSA
jgi:hypothetical protein